MIDIFIWINASTGGGGGPSDPGTGWGGGLGEIDDTMNAITVYAWEEDPVGHTFVTINPTVIVDPRSYAENTAGAQSAADDFTAEVTALQGAGFKGAFRYWKEDVIASGDVLQGDWWDTIDAYDPIPVDATLQSWWDDFNARVTSNAVTPDYKIHDFEEGIGYFQLPDEGTRQTHFESITIDDANNPYPNTPNPYIGAEIWKYSDPLTDQFIQEYNQFAAEKRTTFLKALTNSCPVDSAEKYSNYEDYLQSYEIGNLRNLPNRLPAAQSRLSTTSSPKMYLDYDTVETLTDPGNNFTSTRQLVNRRRWKKFLWGHNKVKSALAAGSTVHPWIAPPGYGANGSDTWASSDILPFEKLLWRVKMRHLRALGIDTFILWNPYANNPNSTDTDGFMDAYFTGLMSRDVNQSVGPTALNSNVVVTNDRITSYDDLYRIGYLYWDRSSGTIEPFSQGFGTAEEPLLVNAGATGNAELADFLAALAIVYGDDEDDPDSYSVPTTSQVTGRTPLPE